MPTIDSQLVSKTVSMAAVVCRALGFRKESALKVIRYAMKARFGEESHQLLSDELVQALSDAQCFNPTEGKDAEVNKRYKWFSTEGDQWWNRESIWWEHNGRKWMSEDKHFPGPRPERAMWQAIVQSFNGANGAPGYENLCARLLTLLPVPEPVVVTPPPPVTVPPPPTPEPEPVVVLPPENPVPPAPVSPPVAVSPPVSPVPVSPPVAPVLVPPAPEPDPVVVLTPPPAPVLPPPPPALLPPPPTRQRAPELVPPPPAPEPDPIPAPPPGLRPKQATEGKAPWMLIAAPAVALVIFAVVGLFIWLTGGKNSPDTAKNSTKATKAEVKAPAETNTKATTTVETPKDNTVTPDPVVVPEPKKVEPVVPPAPKKPLSHSDLKERKALVEKLLSDPSLNKLYRELQIDPNTSQGWSATEARGAAGDALDGKWKQENSGRTDAEKDFEAFTYYSSLLGERVSSAWDPPAVLIDLWLKHRAIANADAGYPFRESEFEVDLSQAKSTRTTYLAANRIAVDRLDRAKKVFEARLREIK